MIFKKFFVVALCCFVLTNANAQFRKYSNEFLSIGIGARSLSMGNSSVASTRDVTAAYWNPAGLMQIEDDIQIGVMHSEYFAGIAKFDYGGVALHSADNTRHMGFSLIRFGIDDIPNTLHLIEPDGSINYDNITAFSVADYAFLFSYAKDIKWKNLSIGGNAKIIHRKAGSFARAWGFGFDVGAQLAHNRWRFGLMARDITTTFNAWSFSFTEEEQQVLQNTGNLVPDNSTELTAPRLILAANYTYPISDKFSAMAEVDLDITTDGERNVLIAASPFSVDPHAGLELGYGNIIFLRGGINNIQRVKKYFEPDNEITVQPNAGVGLVIKNLHIDYALTNIGSFEESGYSHVFSLRVDLNKKVKTP